MSSKEIMKYYMKIGSNISKQFIMKKINGECYESIYRENGQKKEKCARWYNNCWNDSSCHYFDAVDVYSHRAAYRLSFHLCRHWVWGIFVILSRRIEFEYLFTSERLVIDKIINRKRRRNIITSDCSEIEIIAKADSAKFEHYVTQAKKKISAVSSMDSKDIYFFIVNRTIDGKINKILVLFEPDERMLKSIRAAVPRKFSDQT